MAKTALETIFLLLLFTMITARKNALPGATAADSWSLLECATSSERLAPRICGIQFQQ